MIIPLITLSPAAFELWTRHGNVIGNKTWSETHISAHSSGGGDGYGPTMAVRSTASTQHQFFLRDADGQERSAHLTGDASMRDGHVVTVVYIARAGEKTGYPFYFKNHTTGDGDFDLAQFKRVAGEIGCLMLVLMIPYLMIVDVLVSVITGSRALTSLGFIAALGLALFVFLRRRSQWKTTIARLQTDAKAMSEAGAAKSGLA